MRICGAKIIEKIALLDHNNHYKYKKSCTGIVIKILNIHAPIGAIFLVVSDLVVIYCSIAIGLYFSYAPGDLFLNLSINHFLVEKALFLFITYSSLFTIGVYYRRFLTDMKLGLLALALSHLLALGQLALVFYILPDYRIWISALAPALALSFFGLLLSHVCFDRLVGVKLFQRRVVVLGSGQLVEKIQQTIDRSPYLTCVACVAGNSVPNTAPLEVDHTMPNLCEFTRGVGADEIVVAISDRRENIPTPELLACRIHGIQVTEFSTFIERVDGRVEIDGLSPSWMIYSDGFSGAAPVQRNIKRLFDIVFSVILLVLTLPIIVVAGLAVISESAGPVFYCQTRVGAGGRQFKLWKLRSMREDAEADGIARWADERDNRVTRVGRVLRRLRIDELPQLYNVLISDMSFIGPRPERPEFVEQLTREVPFYNYRHNMKPGISGWAQINYPYGNNFDDAIEKLKYDLYYIKNTNLALDFLVLLQTLRVIIWPYAGTSDKLASAPQLDLPQQAPRLFDSTS